MPEHNRKELHAELVRLETEATDRCRNYSIDEQVAMQSGAPREGAATNERMAREKFARINEINLILNTLKWLEIT